MNEVEVFLELPIVLLDDKRLLSIFRSQVIYICLYSLLTFFTSPNLKVIDSQRLIQFRYVSRNGWVRGLEHGYEYMMTLQSIVKLLP